MTQKGKRRLLILSASVAVLIAVLSWMVHTMTREHPDYVEAAKGLSQARFSAANRFGPLTWEEYYAELGLDWVDHSEEWQVLANSVPKEIGIASARGSTPAESQRLFQRHKDWFVSLHKQVTPLTIWAYDNSMEEAVSAKGLARYIHIGIQGAADAGDSEALHEICLAGEAIVARLVEHPTLIHALVAIACRSIVLDAMLRSAVKHRNSDEVMRSLTSSFSTFSWVPDGEKAISGEVRMARSVIDGLRSKSLSQLETSLNEALGSGGSPFFNEPAPVERGIRWILAQVGDEPAVRRQVGKHTLDALEARALEVLLAQSRALRSRGKTYSASRDELKDLYAKASASRDRSYELSEFNLEARYHEVFARHAFHDNAASRSLQLIDKYPNAADLPSALDTKHRFADPFTGNEIVYVRRANGFLIATFGANGVDDGITTATVSTGSARFMQSPKGDDYGWVVEY